MSGYRAFVASTYQDLKAHRTHVISELRRAGIQVDPMEDWTSTSNEPKQFSQERLNGCDFCVLLVALRRGYVPNGETLSITQMEYQEALRRNIDVLPFLVDEEAPWPRTFDELDTDPEVRPWRADLMSKHGVGFFNHEPDSVDIAPAVSRWIAERDSNSKSQKNKEVKHVFVASEPEEKIAFWKQAAFLGPVIAAALGLLGLIAWKFVTPPDNTPPKTAQIIEVRPLTKEESAEEGFSIKYEGATDDRSLKEVRLWVRIGRDKPWQSTDQAQTGESGEFKYLDLQRTKVYFFDVVAKDSSGNQSHDPSGTDGQENRTYLVKNDINVGSITGIMRDQTDENSAELTAALNQLAERNPALVVSDDGIKTPIPDSWKPRLTIAKEKILTVAKATGKIELKNHRNISWVGTGFVVSPDKIATSRSVAEVFVKQDEGGKWLARQGEGHPIQAMINFANDSDEISTAYLIKGVAAMGEHIAILEVENSNNLPQQVELLGSENRELAFNAADGFVIGYPTIDHRVPEQIRELVFNNKFDVKQIMLGTYKFSSVSRTEVIHDCVTFPGTMGGPVVDLKTGGIVGLHMGGSFDEASSRKSNFAVPARELKALLSCTN